VLAEARERATALIREAENQAKTRAAALERELAEAATMAAGKRSADCAERLAALSRENQLALEQLRAIGPERINELAHWAANQILDGVLTEDSR
jgi:hypothetical protein